MSESVYLFTLPARCMDSASSAGFLSESMQFWIYFVPIKTVASYSDVQSLIITTSTSLLCLLPAWCWFPLTHAHHQVHFFMRVRAAEPRTELSCIWPCMWHASDGMNARTQSVQSSMHANVTMPETITGHHMDARASPTLFFRSRCVLQPPMFFFFG